MLSRKVLVALYTLLDAKGKSSLRVTCRWCVAVYEMFSITPLHDADDEPCLVLLDNDNRKAPPLIVPRIWPLVSERAFARSMVDAVLRGELNVPFVMAGKEKKTLTTGWSFIKHRGRDEEARYKCTCFLRWELEDETHPITHRSSMTVFFALEQPTQTVVSGEDRPRNKLKRAFS